MIITLMSSLVISMSVNSSSFTSLDAFFTHTLNKPDANVCLVYVRSGFKKTRYHHVIVMPFKTLCFMTLILLSTSSADPILYQNCLNQVHDHLPWIALDKRYGKRLIWDEWIGILTEKRCTWYCCSLRCWAIEFVWMLSQRSGRVIDELCVSTGGEATGVLCGEPSAPLRRCQPAIVYDNGTPANSLVSSSARFMSVVWM